MKEKTAGFLRKIYPAATLLVLVLLLFLTNFQANTWLSGWDNLHPEFDFAVNLKRSLFAVWQEYQGLGLLGGMGHASDLPRQALLWLFSVTIPTQYLRYFYHSAMLFLGAFGLYFLLKNFVLENFSEGQKKIASLGGAVFYLFNLATIQMFYVPFEVYSAHFAALPWLFWANLNFIKDGGRKNLLFVALINLLSVSQAYVPTFFAVYFVSFSLVCLSYLKNLIFLKRILVIFLLTFTLNAFWLLPNLYFIATGTQVNVSAKINQMATEDNLLKNKKFGNLSDVALLKGFWLDNVEVQKEGVADWQFKSWREHLAKPWIQTLGYFLFAISLLGMIFAFVKKERRLIAFVPVFLLGFILLGTEVPVLGSLSDFFYKIPFLAQIFRFPFTKFAFLLAFCLSLFYASFYFFLSSTFKNKFFQITLGLGFFLLPIIFLFPVFQGKLFYEKEKAKIPEEYFQVFQFFQNQDPNTRIANFPQQTFWGWNFYRFNYSGSGFIWYGIEQPILDRAFDPWSNFNENYYWEVNYALYSQNQELFEKVSEKYQVNWLLVDGNIISPSSAKSLYFDELEQMLATSDKIRLESNFGKIKIYKVNLETPVNNFVYLLENPPAVEPAYKWNNNDQAYVENGNYISGEGSGASGQGKIYYPFRSLFTGRSQSDLEFVVEDKGDFFVFKKTIPEEFQNYSLKIPEAGEKELILVDANDLSKINYLVPEVIFRSESLEVIVPKTGGYYSAQIDPASDPQVQEAKNCNQFSLGEVKNEVVQNEFLRLTSLKALNCSAAFWLPNLPHGLAYLITVESRNVTGKSLLFWLENLNIRKADIETYLPKSPITNHQSQTSYFIQPPMEKDGLGYTLHFDNISIGQEKSINDLGKISVQPIPYRFLTGLKLTAQGNTGSTVQSTGTSVVAHPNPSLYEIQQTTNNIQHNPTLVLSQAYHEGWQAYIINDQWSMINDKLGGILTPILGRQIKERVLVNNWENGWALKEDLKPNEKLVIIFLPQYLEYLGFFLLLLTILPPYLLIKTNTDRHTGSELGRHTG